MSMVRSEIADFRKYMHLVLALELTGAIDFTDLLLFFEMVTKRRGDKNEKLGRH